jgi:hypothetical protein
MFDVKHPMPFPPKVRNRALRIFGDRAHCLDQNLLAQSGSVRGVQSAAGSHPDEGAAAWTSKPKRFRIWDQPYRLSARHASK